MLFFFSVYYNKIYKPKASKEPKFFFLPTSVFLRFNKCKTKDRDFIHWRVTTCPCCSNKVSARRRLWLVSICRLRQPAANEVRVTT